MWLRKLLALVGAHFVGLLLFAVPIVTILTVAPHFRWPGMLFLAFVVVGVCGTVMVYRWILSRLEC